MNRYRHEYKYVLDCKEESVLKVKAQGLLMSDAHADGDGKYSISSLYFDDYKNSGFYEIEDGTDPRSKFRIRYYNNDCSYLRLEKKTKKRGMTYKESCEISKEQCEIFLLGEIPEADESVFLQKKLFEQMRLRQLKPRVIVSYERIAFIYPAGNVRVTFDRALTSSADVAHFLDGTYIRRPVMQQGKLIMEVKWDELLPAFIQENLQIDTLAWTSFSKYYLCRKYNTVGGIV